jgi:hypothetical protein
MNYTFVIDETEHGWEATRLAEHEDDQLHYATNSLRGLFDAMRRDILREQVLAAMECISKRVGPDVDIDAELRRLRGT